MESPRLICIDTVKPTWYKYLIRTWSDNYTKYQITQYNHIMDNEGCCKYFLNFRERSAHNEITWRDYWGGIRQTKLLVEMIHRRCLWEVYDHFHQQPRQKIRLHWVRHQHRSELSHKFYLPAQCRTKRMVLIYWRRTHDIRHASAGILCRNEFIYPIISLIPLSKQKTSRGHHIVQEHWYTQRPADALVNQARPTKNLGG